MNKKTTCVAALGCAAFIFATTACGAYDYSHDFIYDIDPIIKIEAPESDPETEYSYYEISLPYPESDIKTYFIKGFMAAAVALDSHEDESGPEPETSSDTIIESENIIVSEIKEEPKIEKTLPAIARSGNYIYYDIPLSNELQEYTEDVCREYNIDEKLVFAIMGRESAYQPDVISDTNDYGLMQINICNHEWMSEKLGITDFLDPKSSILAGVYMLYTVRQYCETETQMIMCYKSGVNGARALWNQGIHSISYTDQIFERKDNLKIK